MQLLRQADIFVENAPPKLMMELGLSYEVLAQENPRLVVTSITPFGQTGPYRDFDAYDVNCSAAGGLSYSMGYPDRAPLRFPLNQADIQAGLAGAVGSLVALLARDRTGEGQLIDVSESDVLATVHMGNHILNFIYRGITGLRRGYRGDLGQYPFVFLPCKDGYVCVYAPERTQWMRFLEVMGNPEWAKNPRYHNKRAMLEEYPDEVDDLLKPWLKDRTKEEIFALCQDNRVPFAPAYDIREVVENEHLNQRGYFVEIEHAAAGNLLYPGAPFKLSRSPWKISRAAPLLGEHNEKIYCHYLGLSKDDLLNLRRAEVV
jgi:crotonobetainyl-CoA:carnitine CoA-transferase CaiB-like acyl-CoA transferase